MDSISILEELAIQLAEKLADPAIKDAAQREACRKTTLARLVQVIGSLCLVAQSHKAIAETLTNCSTSQDNAEDPPPEQK